MLKQIWSSVRTRLVGMRLKRAVERNQKAADDLDTVLREVLRR
ncbi:MAG: hypothetical protein AAF230_08365 [Pseudomonadota bacterium]